MKIIFFGSSHFGLPSLRALVAAGHEIPCVVTQPDRKKGRGMEMAKTAIKEFAESGRIDVYQPEDVNASESAVFLKKHGAEMFVVIAYGQILSRRLLDIPALMPLNVHASILPFYRGAAPINWAIINGEEQTGVSVIKMTEKMDAGPVIAVRRTAIGPEEDSLSLEQKLSLLAAPLLVETVEMVGRNDYKITSQDEKMATMAPRLKKSDGLIDWNRQPGEIANLIRGLSGWPGAFTYFYGKMLKVLKAVAGGVHPPGNAGPGGVISVSKEGVVVAAKNGTLAITKLQLEGKREMTAQEFIAGHKIIPGDKLTSSAA